MASTSPLCQGGSEQTKQTVGQVKNILYQGRSTGSKTRAGGRRVRIPPSVALHPTIMGVHSSLEHPCWQICCYVSPQRQVAGRGRSLLGLESTRLELPTVLPAPVLRQSPQNLGATHHRDSAARMALGALASCLGNCLVLVLGGRGGHQEA